MSVFVAATLSQWVSFWDSGYNLETRFMRLGFLLSTICIASPVMADDLTIMNWNIANLASDIGVSLRDGSHIRTEEDYERIREIITDTDPDIIALQEIGSIAAARSILGEEYDVYFESRCTAEICDADHGDIYSAIAHRNDLPVEDLRPFQIDELSTFISMNVEDQVGLYAAAWGYPSWMRARPLQLLQFISKHPAQAKAPMTRRTVPTFKMTVPCSTSKSRS